MVFAVTALSGNRDRLPLPAFFFLLQEYFERLDKRTEE